MTDGMVWLWIAVTCLVAIPELLKLIAILEAGL